MTDLDPDRIAHLTAEIMARIMVNYRTGPASRDRVFEGLNALASSAAMIITSAPSEARFGARQFFERALDAHLLDFLQAARELPDEPTYAYGRTERQTELVGAMADLDATHGSIRR